MHGRKNRRGSGRRFCVCVFRTISTASRRQTIRPTLAAVVRRSEKDVPGLQQREEEGRERGTLCGKTQAVGQTVVGERSHTDQTSVYRPPKPIFCLLERCKQNNSGATEAICCRARPPVVPERSGLDAPPPRPSSGGPTCSMKVLRSTNRPV